MNDSCEKCGCGVNAGWKESDDEGCEFGDYLICPTCQYEIIMNWALTRKFTDE